MLLCEKLVKVGVDIVVLDSAHGHSKGIMDVVKKVKDKFPNLDIIAGNIATKEAAIDVAKTGEEKCRE